jgi:beta-glucanase (GH16 family)
MHFLATTVLAGLAASLASAQTFTTCDPTKKTCPNNPAIGTPFTSDFKTGEASLEGWTITANNVNFTDEGANFIISKRGEAPTIQTNGYLHYGRAEVRMRASGGQGIVSSIVLQSDDLDEIDWEWVGTDTAHVQTNYFGKGNTTTYDRGTKPEVTNPQGKFYTYALDWTAEQLVWSIDGKTVRTLHYKDAVDGKNYPQTPCNLRIGIWAGGDEDNNPGTIEWAGGKTDYTKAPFTMTVESVKVINNSPGKEYQWTDKTGDSKSIKVIGAGDTAGGAESSVITLSATSTASATNKGGLGSIIDTPSSVISSDVQEPTASGAISHSEGCTESKSATVTAVASPSTSSPAETTVIYPPSSTALSPEQSSSNLPVTQISDGQIQVPPASSTASDTTPCSCGISTVTITGVPIPVASTPVESSPAESTPVESIPSTPAPASTATPTGPLPVTQISDGQIQVPPAPSTSDTLAQPLSSSSTALLTEIPYPTTAVLASYSGLVTETRTAPSVPVVSASIGLGNGTATSTGGLAQFTGAAVAGKVNGVFAAVAGLAALLVV